MFLVNLAVPLSLTYNDLILDASAPHDPNEL